MQKWTNRFLDPEIEEMVRFLDPEIVEMVERSFMKILGTFKIFLKISVCLRIQNLGVERPKKIAQKFSKILI